MFNLILLSCAVQIIPGVVDVSRNGDKISLVSKYTNVNVNGEFYSQHVKMIKAEEAAINLALSCDIDAPGALLSWDKPILRIDGSDADITGYNIAIYCDDYNETKQLPGDAVQYHSPDAIGQCEFSISAIDANGSESTILTQTKEILR